MSDPQLYSMLLSMWEDATGNPSLPDHVAAEIIHNVEFRHFKPEEAIVGSAFRHGFFIRQPFKNKHPHMVLDWLISAYARASSIRECLENNVVSGQDHLDRAIMPSHKKAYREELERRKDELNRQTEKESQIRQRIHDLFNTQLSDAGGHNPSGGTSEDGGETATLPSGNLAEEEVS